MYDPNGSPCMDGLCHVKPCVWRNMWIRWNMFLGTTFLGFSSSAGVYWEVIGVLLVLGAKTKSYHMLTLPRHSMYAIYAYIGVVLGGQLIGIYGSLMKCLGSMSGILRKRYIYIYISFFNTTRMQKEFAKQTHPPPAVRARTRTSLILFVKDPKKDLLDDSQGTLTPPIALTH